MKKFLVFPYIFLFFIVLASFAIRAYNLNFNSIFVDEAAYIVIGQKILSGNLSSVFNDITWVGGFPYIYPFFSAFFYNLGGILGVRFFNVILGTLSVLLIYFFTVQLNLFKEKKSNQITGLVSAALMAVATIPVEASRLAIYDALSFTLFLLGLNFFLKAVRDKDRKFYVLTAVTIFISFLAKYTPMFYVPFLLLSGWFLTEARRKNFIKYLWIPTIILFGLYFLGTAQNLMEFFTTQVGDISSPFEILQIFLKYSWIIFIFSFMGAAILWKTKKYEIEGLYFLSLVPLVVHVLTKNNNTMHQHVFLTLIFILPLASAFFAWIVEKNRITGLAAIISILIFSTIYLNNQLRDLENFWPNSDRANAILRERLRTGDIVLAEGSDSTLLALNGRISSDRLIGPFSFSYKNLEDEAAYTQAINDGYFRLIEIENEYFSQDFIVKLSPILALKYVKIFDDGRIQVYERK